MGCPVFIIIIIHQTHCIHFLMCILYTCFYNFKFFAKNNASMLITSVMCARFGGRYVTIFEKS